MSVKGNGAGVPAWMVTFADLMALMMTFFVLLYSFSTIDEKKYRLIAQSMAKGFGAVLAAPRPSTTTAIGPPSMVPSPLSQNSRALSPQPRPEMANRNDRLMEQLRSSMRAEIAEGIIAVETAGNTVVIRFPEEIAFPPGSDEMSDDILPMLGQVADALRDTPGTIMVSGHTDDQPIRSARFRSNWELSTDRAVSVIQQLESIGGIESARLTAVGYGDTRPLAPNDSAENRARNRRVEIAVVREENAD